MLPIRECENQAYKALFRAPDATQLNSTGSWVELSWVMATATGHLFFVMENAVIISAVQGREQKMISGEGANVFGFPDPFSSPPCREAAPLNSARGMGASTFWNLRGPSHNRQYRGSVQWKSPSVDIDVDIRVYSADIMRPDENWVTTEAHSVQLSWVDSGALNTPTTKLNSTENIQNCNNSQTSWVELSRVVKSIQSARQLNSTQPVKLSWVVSGALNRA